MIIYNFKLNKKLILKTCLVIMAIICFSLACVSIYNIFFSNPSSMNLIDDSIPSQEPAEIISSNYTNILKQVHNNLDTYVGQKITFTGYVYKLDTFNDNQFVLARDMDIGNNKSLVVGFLCEVDKNIQLKESTWVNVTGSISKGIYNGEEIPIIKVIDLKETSTPVNPNVPMPDDEYVPTALIY